MELNKCSGITQYFANMTWFRLTDEKQRKGFSVLHVICIRNGLWPI